MNSNVMRAIGMAIFMIAVLGCNESSTDPALTGDKGDWISEKLEAPSGSQAIKMKALSAHFDTEDSISTMAIGVLWSGSSVAEVLNLSIRPRDWGAASGWEINLSSNQGELKWGYSLMHSEIDSTEFALIER